MENTVPSRAPAAPCRSVAAIVVEPGAITAESINRLMVKRTITYLDTLGSESLSHACQLLATF